MGKKRVGLMQPDLKWKYAETFEELDPKWQNVVCRFCENGQNKNEAYSTIFADECKDQLTASTIRERANEFFGTDNIKKIVSEMVKDFYQSRTMCPDEIFATLTAISRGEVADQFSKKTSVKDRLDATKSLAKLWGMETQKVDLNANVKTILVNDVENEDIEIEEIND